MAESHPAEKALVDVKLPPSIEEMIRQGNLMRKLGGEACVKARRDEHMEDIQGLGYLPATSANDRYSSDV